MVNLVTALTKFTLLTALLLLACSCGDTTPLDTNPDPGRDAGFMDDANQALCDEPDFMECDGVCIDPRVDNHNCGQCGKTCQDNQLCHQGRCQPIKCEPLETVCDRQCVDTDHDHENCGECGNRCEGDETCTRGECLAQCPQDLTRCGSHCVNTHSDPGHCGRCHLQCQEGETCLLGECQGDQCPEGLSHCYGGCVNIQVDDSHCGQCGRQCPEGHICWAASCILDCQEGLTACGSSCVDTLTDTEHCGACDRPCASGEVCDNGQCHLTCQDGLTNCLGVCTNLQTDRNNCGFCTKHCPDGQVCVNGNCSLNCPTGLNKCGNYCVNIHTDRFNCGECGNRCPGGQVCTFGNCETTCPHGQTPCGDLCSTLSQDDLNCGECGIICSQGYTCQEGLCQIACPVGYHPCEDSCVLLNTDTDHCGRCGNDCHPGALCRNGQCITPVTGLTLSPPTAQVSVGSQVLLTPAVTPSNATDRSLTWATSAGHIATVNTNGAVTGHAAGQAVITVTSHDGAYLATSLVTVTIPVATVTLIPDRVYLMPEQSAHLQAIVLPEDATNKDLIWASTDPAIATVDSGGRVQGGSSLGSTTITATTVNGGKQASATVTIAITPVTGLTLEPQSLFLFPGEQTLLTATVSPPHASDKTLFWHSSDPAIAAIDQQGLITPISLGKATITAITMDGGYSAKTSVLSGIPVTGMELTPDTLLLPLGGQFTLIHRIIPEDATLQGVTWNSTNPAVATVTGDGQINGLSLGSTVITVTSDYGGFTGSCHLTVVVPAGGISINPVSFTMYSGDTAPITATVTPANAGIKDVIWTSSDNRVVSVVNSTASDCIITARGSGEATITGTTKDGGFTATAQVKVGRYVYDTHTFTNCTRTGYMGPLLAQCRPAYGTPWSNDTSLYNIISYGVQLWTVPDTGTYRIEARGAQGGGANSGLGAVMSGEFQLTANQVLRVLAGQQGINNMYGGGGGGASAVSLNNSSIPLIVAGGGGGSGLYHSREDSDATSTTTGKIGHQNGGVGGTSGSGGRHVNMGGGGGAGWNSNGTGHGAQGGYNLRSTAYGGTSPIQGGFGGGGAGINQYASNNTHRGGGGGGGYSGGGGGAFQGSGGGGGSYNGGSNQTNQSGVNTGAGSVTITRL